MTTNDESGWDDLVEEFGLKSDTPPVAAKSDAPVAKPAARPAKALPEPEPEGDDFGLGLPASAPRSVAALYDPGPEAVSDDEEDDLDDEASEADEASEGQEGGKPKKRRRRRRKKKGASVTGEGGSGELEAIPAESDDSNVEQGEAPAEVEDDDDDEVTPHSAIDEEMEEEASQPRPEWHVMTWVELVSKLNRPG